MSEHDINDFIDLDVSDPSDDKKWVVLYDEDYTNVMLDGNDNVAVLVDERQAFEMWRLATIALEELADMEIEELDGMRGPRGKTEVDENE